MTPTQARHVSHSFGRVFPFHKRLTDAFYSTLFELAPDTRALFPDDLSVQKQKLASTLQTVVQNLGKLDTIMAPVRALGVRHAGYGAAPAHYEAVGLALITALKQVTPGGLSEAEERAWVAAYNVLATAMIDAADAHRTQRASA
ncbi:MAG: globin domain-containing protein [Pseudomonadota bacterium]